MNLFSDRSSIGTHHYNSLWRMFFLLLLVGVTPVFIWAVMTQRIELRKRAATSEVVVCWNRVLPSTEGNHAWPNGCKGDPVAQVCSQSTVSLTASEQYMYNQWVAGGKQYIPGCGMTPPVAHSINWRTQYAYLSASDLVITANGKVFKGISSGPMSVHSNPASATYTTLETTWMENGVEMRMNIYFDASTCTKSIPPQCNWKITELRIYNGNAQGDWIYFTGGDTLSVGARVGTEYTNQKLMLTSSQNGIGKVEFTNLRIQAFINQSGSGLTCGGIRGEICQPGYQCIYTNGSTKAQYPDESGKCVSLTSSCSVDGSACTIRSCPTMPPCPAGKMCPQVMPACSVTSGICRGGTCQTKITPTPTCLPRPACMDPLPGQPQCMYDLPQGAWLCPKTPTPTQACIPLPECVYNPPIVNGRPVLCSIAPPPNGSQYCPRPTVTPTVTPTILRKPGDFNADGKVDIFDYSVVLAQFGKTGSIGFTPADLNDDGKVDLYDYNLMLNYFGK